MAAKLKVFCASNGLTRSYVAVSSKAKALEAWGSKQDLFKEGLAEEVTDPAQMEAALARPGEVVTRSALDAGAVEAALAALPKPKPSKAGKAESKRGPSRELLERVAKFERKLADNDARERDALADIASRRAVLDAEETEVRGQAARRRRELDEKLTAAREAVEAASR
ncbi:MAG: hypothetical protein KY446_08300 [Proteobacteria bacterium]|nr:hypothetical protein [Pseudomonadota bacterium]